MFRSSRNIVLTILGSAALLGCCLFPSCSESEQPVLDANGNPVHDANGNVVYHHRTYYNQWYGPRGYYGYGWPFWHSSPYSSYSSGGGASGVRSSFGSTSRGGFGATGHASAGS